MHIGNLWNLLNSPYIIYLLKATQHFFSFLSILGFLSLSIYFLYNLYTTYKNCFFFCLKFYIKNYKYNYTQYIHIILVCAKYSQLYILY